MLIYPYLAFVIAGVAIAGFFLSRFLRSKQPFQLVCCVLWLLPAAYEAWVQSTCTGECNIRIDLAVVFPLELFLLIPASLIALRSYEPRGRAVGE